MARLRWGEDAPGDTDQARERLIDAAEASFQKYGVMKTTVEDVASMAEVSRATVYRYFSGRDELILGVLLREGGRHLERLRSRIDTAKSFEDAMLTGVLYTLRSIRRDANLALLFAPEAAGVTSSIGGASEALFSLTANFLEPYFEEAQANGVMRNGLDHAEAAEWVLRCILSLVTVGGPRVRSDTQLRAFLRTYLIPGLVVPSGDVPARASAASAGRRRRSAPSRR